MGTGTAFCHNCGSQTHPLARVCTRCGVMFAQGAPGRTGKSRLTAGLLGIFLGHLGIHRFYLGYNTIGLVMLLVSVIGGALTFGVLWGAVSIWGLVEGIMVFTGGIDRDADGNPLAS